MNVDVHSISTRKVVVVPHCRWEIRSLEGTSDLAEAPGQPTPEIASCPRSRWHAAPGSLVIIKVPLLSSGIWLHTNDMGTQGLHTFLKVLETALDWVPGAQLSKPTEWPWTDHCQPLLFSPGNKGHESTCQPLSSSPCLKNGLYFCFLNLYFYKLHE